MIRPQGLQCSPVLVQDKRNRCWQWMDKKCRPVRGFTCSNIHLLSLTTPSQFQMPYHGAYRQQLHPKGKECLTWVGERDFPATSHPKSESTTAAWEETQLIERPPICHFCPAIEYIYDDVLRSVYFWFLQATKSWLRFDSRAWEQWPRHYYIKNLFAKMPSIDKRKERQWQSNARLICLTQMDRTTKWSQLLWISWERMQDVYYYFETVFDLQAKWGKNQKQTFAYCRLQRTENSTEKWGGNEKRTTQRRHEKIITMHAFTSTRIWLSSFFL